MTPPDLHALSACSAGEILQYIDTLIAPHNAKNPRAPRFDNEAVQRLLVLVIELLNKSTSVLDCGGLERLLKIFRQVQGPSTQLFVSRGPTQYDHCHLTSLSIFLNVADLRSSPAHAPLPGIFGLFGRLAQHVRHLTSIAFTVVTDTKQCAIEAFAHCVQFYALLHWSQHCLRGGHLEPAPCIRLAVCWRPTNLSAVAEFLYGNATPASLRTNDKLTQHLHSDLGTSSGQARSLFDYVDAFELNLDGLLESLEKLRLIAANEANLLAHTRRFTLSLYGSTKHRKIVELSVEDLRMLSFVTIRLTSSPLRLCTFSIVDESSNAALKDLGRCIEHHASDRNASEAQHRRKLSNLHRLLAGFEHCSSDTFRFARQTYSDTVPFAEQTLAKFSAVSPSYGNTYYDPTFRKLPQDKPFT